MIRVNSCDSWLNFWLILVVVIGFLKSIFSLVPKLEGTRGEFVSDFELRISYFKKLRVLRVFMVNQASCK